MSKLSFKMVKAIEELVANKFDKIILRFIGIVPEFNKRRLLGLKNTRTSLPSLFLNALGTKEPNKDEEDSLKICLKLANDYLEALKLKTQAQIITDLNDTMDKSPSVVNISRAIREGFNKVTTPLNVILNGETNRCTNTANALKIQKIAAEKGEEDPTVFFVVRRDERNDPETLRLHLLPDEKPRAWKLSSLNTGYHDRKGMVPTIIGTSQFCRCFLSYIPKNFGFSQDGKLEYKEEGWDEYKYQQENYPPPMTAEAFKAKLKREKSK